MSHASIDDSTLPGHTRVLIIGSGPAGYTAAVYASRAMLSPVLIQGTQPGGQLTITTEVENWPGETEIQGPDLMVKMEAHARAMGARIFIDTVTALDLSRRPFTAQLDSGWELHGAPSIAFDAARGVMRCAQAVTKEIEADYHPDMKLGQQ